jgi:hypothetical protein
MSPPEMIAVCTVDLDERRDSFSALLRSLPRDIQLVVTLRGPREPDNELLELMPSRHTLLRVPAASLSVARNLALREIAAWDIDDTTVIAFPDDDCTWSPTTGPDVQQQFADPSLELLLGRYRPVDDEFDERYPDEPADLTPTMVMSRCASIVMFARAATAVLLEFDEQLGVGAKYPATEDTDFALRVLARGGTARYSPDVVCFHRYETSGDPSRRVVAGFLIGRHIRHFPRLVVPGARWLMSRLLRGPARLTALRFVLQGLRGKEPSHQRTARATASG